MSSLTDISPGGSAQLQLIGNLPQLTRSVAMQELLGRLSVAIRETGGVLVTGEPGAGHDAIARAIHLSSDDTVNTSVDRLLLKAVLRHASHRPFVALNCSERLDLEERLFGGAQTPVAAAVAGFEQLAAPCLLTAAHGGTLLLRHIPEMPARLQVRLGRLLRRGEAHVVQNGVGPALVPVAVRVVGTAEGDGDLEPELLRRLPVTINVPPLRDRREDIPGLVRCLLDELSVAAGIAPKIASRQAAELLSALPWRGNVSELEALLRALVTHIPGRHIRLSHVLAFVRLDGRATASTYTGTLKEARECFERDYVAAVLDRHRGRMAEAAKTLGLQRTNLYRKVRQLSVTRGSAKRQLSER